MILRCFLFLAATCNLASSNAVRFAYLPPEAPKQDNTTTMDNTTEASNDTLSQRFGEDGILHFDGGSGMPMLLQRQVDQVISKGIQQLTLDLGQALGSGGSRSQGRGISPAGSNVIFSPTSIAGALILVLLGAGGKTYQELAYVLGLTDRGTLQESDDVIHQEYSRVLRRFEERPGVITPAQVLAASAIFLQEGYPVFPRYQQLSQSLYNSDIINLDFVNRGYDALAAVNKWVDKKTRGRIMNFLSEPPSSETRLLIASALYFNGAWEIPFPEDVTTKRPFYVNGDAKMPTEVLEVTMMANSAELPFYASPTLGCRLLGLPYKGGEVSMYIVLPNKTGIGALRELEQKLSPVAIDEMVRSATVQSVIVLLPRMKLESTISLKDALRSLGVQTLFDPFAANLSRISSGMSYGQHNQDDAFIFSRMGDDNSTKDELNTTGNEVNTKTTRAADKDGMVFRHRRQAASPGLYADDAIHRVEIEITETGTVASAVTVLSVSRDGSRETFRVDRPFLFFIRHEPTGLILFWGSVVRPTPSTVKK